MRAYEMLPLQRHRLILHRLERDGVVSIAALSQEMGVSRETLRRDINLLADRQQVVRAFGGALSLSAREAREEQRAMINADGKRAIGVAAARLVTDGAAVILDSGTTTRAVANALLIRRQLTIYTNDLEICRRLGRNNENRVILLGGELQVHEDATLGLDAIDNLTRYKADFAFVGAGGITPDGHLTDFTREASELRGLMLLSATTGFVVADHTKFDHVTPVRVPSFGKGHGLITDKAPAATLRANLERLGVRLLIA